MRIYVLLMTVVLLVACSEQDDNPIAPETSQSSLPSVAITTPQTGAIFDRGIYPVYVSANHRSGIQCIILKIGMKDIRYDYAAPFSFIWLVAEDAQPTVGEGDYTICATAIANTGEYSSHCIKVEVDYK